MKPVILTGLRANNDLHIGNYFGALLPMIDMAKNSADEYPNKLVRTRPAQLHNTHRPRPAARPNNANLRLYVAAGLPLDNPDIHIYPPKLCTRP